MDNAFLAVAALIWTVLLISAIIDHARVRYHKRETDRLIQLVQTEILRLPFVRDRDATDAGDLGVGDDTNEPWKAEVNQSISEQLRQQLYPGMVRFDDEATVDRFLRDDLAHPWQPK